MAPESQSHTNCISKWDSHMNGTLNSVKLVCHSSRPHFQIDQTRCWNLEDYWLDIEISRTTDSDRFSKLRASYRAIRGGGCKESDGCEWDACEWFACKITTTLLRIVSESCIKNMSKKCIVNKKHVRSFSNVPLEMPWVLVLSLIMASSNLPKKWTSTL